MKQFPVTLTHAAVDAYITAAHPGFTLPAPRIRGEVITGLAAAYRHIAAQVLHDYANELDARGHYVVVPMLRARADELLGHSPARAGEAAPAACGGGYTRPGIPRRHQPRRCVVTAHRRLAADERLLTPGEVADLFAIHPKSVTRWAKTGRLPCVRTLGGHRRFREVDVYALLHRNRWSTR